MGDTPGDRSTRDTLAERRGLTGDVYPPAEDSRLLGEAAQTHARGGVLDLGTGSGWIAAKLQPEPGVAWVIGSDINPHACRAAHARGVATVRADLLDPFHAGTFDTIVFNPPYLPALPETEFDDWMETALSGGERGREVVTRFLDDLDRVLAPSGRALILVSSLTGPDAVLETARTEGFGTERLRRESYPYEVLSVYMLRRE